MTKNDTAPYRPDMTAFNGPKYRRIAEAMARDIHAGILPPGLRLPTHRDMSYRLDVTVGTVTRAYQELERRGLIGGHVGRGTFVVDKRERERDQIFPIAPRALPSDDLAAPPTDDGVIDMAMNRPTPGPEGAALAATLAELAGAGDLAVLTQYNPAPGLVHQRAAMAGFLSHVGLEATADEMILTSGAQHAMAACALGLLNAGDVILTEDLTYPGLTSLAAHLNVRVRGVAMDGEGLRPDALEAAVRDTGARVVYVTPVHQNPTTATMGAERLADIARVVRDHDLVVMEDDVYGFQPARREPPLQTLAPDNVIYISGFAKSVAPGLRVGCVKAPRTLFSTLTQTVQITGWMTAPLMGEIATRWIADGTAAELIRWHRDEMVARNRMALETFQGMALQSQPESLHLWLDLPDGHHCVDCLQALTRAGVGVAGSHSFATQAGGSPRAVRLCLGSPTTRDELAEGLARVKSVLSAPPATQPTHCTPMVM